jgi:hypothetical protein
MEGEEHTHGQGHGNEHEQQHSAEMQERRTFRHLVSPVTEGKKMMMTQPVRYQYYNYITFRYIGDAVPLNCSSLVELAQLSSSSSAQFT